MTKRRREDDVFKVSKRLHVETLLTKRKNIDFTNDMDTKKARHADAVVDDLRSRNFELEQTVMALCQKIQQLEYMLQMFQRNETIGHNRLVHAY